MESSNTTGTDMVESFDAIKVVEKSIMVKIFCASNMNIDYFEDT